MDSKQLDGMDELSSSLPFEGAGERHLFLCNDRSADDIIGTPRHQYFFQLLADARQRKRRGIGRYIPVMVALLRADGR